MNKYIIIGAYGGANIGDDLILHVLLSVLKKTGNGNSVNIFSTIKDEKIPQRKIAGERIFGFNIFCKLFFSLCTRQLIFGGGQLLNGGNERKSIYFAILVGFINRVFLKKPIMVGVGQGGCASALDEFLMSLIPFFYSEVVVRDRYTANLMSKYKPVSLSSDLVYTHTKEMLLSISSKLNLAETENDSVLVFVHGHPKKKYIESADLMKFLVNCRSMNIKIAVQDTRDLHDKNVAEEIDAFLKENKIKSEVKVLASAEEMLEEINRAGVVISARMHPLICGSILGKKIGALAKSKKIEELKDDLNFYSINLNENFDCEINKCHKVETLNLYSASKVIDHVLR